MLDLASTFDPDAVEAAVCFRQEDAIDPSDLPGDWRVEWEERAAIMEYDGGLPRERAEALALEDVLRRMRHAGDVIARDHDSWKEQCDGGS